MADGFLGRWARRKHEAAQGKALDEPVKPSPQPSPASGRGSQAAVSSQLATGSQLLTEQVGGTPPLPPAAEGRGEGVASKPMPTLDDVKGLTRQSDFSAFMARGVDPEVKNAAMKKLFTDPHYNVMDRLDIYIDDYSKPDPLPLSMLRQMASAKFLNLFEEDPKKQAGAPLRDNASLPAADPSDAATAVHASSDALTAVKPERQTELSGAPKAEDALPTIENHADTDLRLQQDHAAGAPGSGRGAQ
jgi:hypothetical protein